MTLLPIVLNALLYAIILCIVLFTAILVLTRINPEIMLKEYPPDIQEKYGPMSERSKRQRIPVAIFIITLMAGIVTLSFGTQPGNAGGDISFLAAFVHLFTLFATFNLLDWLVLDWLIVVTILPGFMILPGTEGLAGYKDYQFHFRGFVKGMGISTAASLVLAGIIAAL